MSKYGNESVYSHQRALVGIQFARVAGFLCAVGALLGCKIRTFNNTDKSSASTVQNTQSAAQEIDQIWQMMRAEHLKDIQPQCEPQRYSPPQGITKRGSAVLLHGYSACPDQYDVLGPQLAAQGYEVFVPLFPGHGAKPLALKPRKDDVEHVPRVGAGWGPFVTRINELGQKFSGERVLVGLSHGSNLALRAIQLQPTLWDKAFLMAPKLANETSFFKFLLSSPIHILSIDQLSETEDLRRNPTDYGDQQLLSTRSGWRKCSEVDVNPPGNRGGFCNFENRHALAMFELGDLVIKSAETLAQRETSPRTQVQFVLSVADNGTCNNATQRVMRALNKSSSTAQACMMPKEVPHSMISRHDSPYDKPWTKPLFNQVGLFFSQGTFVPGSSEVVSPCQLAW